MGKEFGKLQRLYGVTYYVLSPYEMRPFAGMLTPGLRNTVRRFKESYLYFVYVFGLFAPLRYIANQMNEAHGRKNPDDYLCDR